MQVLIIGCGRTGSRLARRLSQSGHEVRVVDESRESFSRLGTKFSGLTFQGSGLDKDTLQRAGADKADVVVAVTGGDNRNLMVAQMVKHQYGIERAVARLHDPVRSFKFRELGVETLCTTTVMEGLLELYVNNGEFPELPGEMSVYGDDSALQEI